MISVSKKWLVLLTLFGIYWILTNLTPSSHHQGPPQSESGCHVKNLYLPAYAQIHHWTKDIPDKIFLMETSSRSRLPPRAACAVESAAANTNLSAVVMLFRSSYLDLTDNLTCNLYMKLTDRGSRVYFFRAMPELDLQDTPLLDLYTSGNISKSEYANVHLANALRIAYVYKYGGWYGDTDFLFLRPLSGSAKRSGNLATTQVRRALTNAIFIFDKGHVVLKTYMEEFRRNHTGLVRYEVGPPMMTEVVRRLCRSEIVDLVDSDRCSLLTVAEPREFCPVVWFRIKLLFPGDGSMTPERWDALIGDARAIHFFSSASRGQRVSGDPSMDAYSYYGPRHCPVSFASALEF